MFTNLSLLPQDPIYGMQVLYKADSRPDKINLSIGICLDEESKLLRFQAIDEALERIYLNKPSKGYLPITGLTEYSELAQNLVLGSFSANNFFSTQTVGGTGALFVAAKLFLSAGRKEIFIPDPSWPNHKQLFEEAGLRVKSYPYLNKEKVCLDFDKMLQAISDMPEKSIIVLHASCHNPTGVDPTREEWQAISKEAKKKNLIALFDLAYLGLGKSLQDDLQAIHTFIQDDHELLIATTFAKSMGLYNDRLGLLTVRSRDNNVDVVASHIRSIIRTCYSSPPAHGAYIAHEILRDENLKTLWLSELDNIRLRLTSQRKLLYDELKKTGCKIPYEQLLSTNGLFCLFDLSSDEISTLRKRDGIYLSVDGRMSVAAITKKNVEQIARSLSNL